MNVQLEFAYGEPEKEMNAVYVNSDVIPTIGDRVQVQHYDTDGTDLGSVSWMIVKERRINYLYVGQFYRIQVELWCEEESLATDLKPPQGMPSDDPRFRRPHG